MTKAFADITAAIAVLHAEVRAGVSGGGLGRGPGGDAFSAEGDPLRGLSEDCLDVLAGAAAADAQMAGLKARAAMTYADTVQAAAAPDASVPAQELAVTAEVACALSIGERAAGSFLAVSHALATTLPLTLAGLQAGSISWQHARVMADEAATLGVSRCSCVGGPLPGPGRTGRRPGLSRRGNAGVPVPAPGADLARTPPRREYRDAARQGCPGPAG